MRSMITLTGTICFWIVCSESLVLAGNSAGRGVVFSLTSLLLFSLVVVVLLSVSLSGKAQESGLHRSFVPDGVPLLMPLGLCGIVGSTLFASTGILVTAGFTFNEVFYYRFPNFAFSFLVLGVVLLVQMLPEQVRTVCQSLFVFTCLCLLVLITGAGLFLGSGLAPGTPLDTGNSPAHLISLSLLLVFTGFDQIKDSLYQKIDFLRAVGIIGLAVILLTCWIYVSAQFVASERLVFSTIPYMATATKILGETGRSIMGAAIIAGSFAAVNGLIAFSRRYTESNALLKFNHSGKLAAVVISLVIGVLIATGVAGTDDLEIFIRSSLLIWLVYSGCCGILESYHLRGVSPVMAVFGVAAGGLILICSLELFLSQEELKTAVLFTMAMLAGSALISVLVRLLGRSKGQASIIN